MPDPHDVRLKETDKEDGEREGKQNERCVIALAIRKKNTQDVLIPRALALKP